MKMLSARALQIWFTCLVAALLGCAPDANKDANKTESAQQGSRSVSQPPGTQVADTQISNPAAYPFKFVAYGDMRFTEPKSIIGRVVANGRARQQVIDQIGKEAPPFLVVTGDFVFRGFHQEDWDAFDQAIKPLRDRGTLIFPAIGNHEVGPFKTKKFGVEFFQEIENKTKEEVASLGLKKYYQQFPGISNKPWYWVRYANCYFLMLDSEVEDMPTLAAQEHWINAQLDAMPAEIDYIFFAMHRAPITALTGPKDDVHTPRKMETDLSQLLEKRQKTTRARMIVISGHVHNYERFRRQDVNYIVSGGGGAKPAKFFPHRDPGDLYPQNPLYGKSDPADEDQFHYCVFTVDHSKLSFQMMKLVSKANTVSFEPRDSFVMDIAGH
jgi:hypothetical protein